MTSTDATWDYYGAEAWGKFTCSCGYGSERTIDEPDRFVCPDCSTTYEIRFTYNVTWVRDGVPSGVDQPTPADEAPSQAAPDA